MQPNQLLGGRYRLVERIGAGGMGEVWRAEDITLERAVAVKALHPAMADDADFRERFLREARTVAALNVPGVVAMFDSGEETTPDGSILSYLVMEFVVGRPLSDYVPSAESLPSNEVMRLVAQVARGLDAAHRVGIIHRDVKATNILVNKAGDATLVDFGIARRHGETGLTTTGSVMGTTEYAAPEQLRDEPLTPASDVYSLGVVAYECLAGARPFDGQSVAAVVAGHLNRTPPALPGSVPPPIAAVVMRALAKDPRDRYPTAAEFTRACREAVAAAATRVRTRPIPVGPAAASPAAAPTRQRPAEPFAPPGGRDAPRRRSRAPALVAGIVALAALAVVGVMLFTMDSHATSDDGPTGDPTTAGASDNPGPDKPVASPLVSADNTLCLLSSHVIGESREVKARMGLCQDARYPKYTFASVGDQGVAIRFTNEYNGNEFDSCLGVDTESVSLVSAQHCGAETAWTFKHLRTEDGVAYWQVSSNADGGMCLQAGAAQGDAAFVEHCDGSAAQQWRTEITS